ncbi:hypothetical protein, partial [Klebsiella pneumoniae]|uniref:hypothetical protein n=1 Tax=Klebsiella pneumoniae TaxID=573 RepID=UPI003D08533E
MGKKKGEEGGKGGEEGEEGKKRKKRKGEGQRRGKLEGLRRLDTRDRQGSVAKADESLDKKPAALSY